MMIVKERGTSALVVSVQGVNKVCKSNKSVGGACTYAMWLPLAPRDLLMTI
jgi:hypothetical protein